MAEQTDSRKRVASARQTWYIQRPASAWAGFVVLAVLLAGEAVFLRRWLAVPISPQRVALVPALVVVALLAAALAVHLASCLALHVVVDGRVVTIVRGTARWVVPLAAIESVHRGEPGAVLVRRLLLPGFAVGHGYVKDGGPALFFCTQSPQHAVSVRTAGCTYLLSPQQPEAFMAALDERRAQAAPAPGAEPEPGLLPVLSQPAVIVLACLAALVNLGLYAHVAHWYAGPDVGLLPSALPALRAGMPLSLFWLPVLGTLILAANLLVSTPPPFRRPATTYVLVAVALLAQVLLWLAFVTMLA